MPWEKGALMHLRDSWIPSKSSHIYRSIKKTHLKQNNFKAFPKPQILDASKLKEFADSNFKFDENGRRSPNEWKTLGKGEIARNEQFLLYPLCFLKDLYC